MCHFCHSEKLRFRNINYRAGRICPKGSCYRLGIENELFLDIRDVLVDPVLRYSRQHIHIFSALTQNL